MAVQQSLRNRQLGLQQGAGQTSCRLGHQAQAFLGRFAGNVALVKRLTCSLELEHHGGPLSAVSWSQDGALLATGGDDCKVKIWDAVAGTELLCLTLVSSAAATRICYVRT